VEKITGRSWVCQGCGGGFMTEPPAGALCGQCVAGTGKLGAAVLQDAARAALGQYEQAGEGYVEALAEVCRSVLAL
jgi:hypothetical protein